jgi:hypothetical protein
MGEDLLKFRHKIDREFEETSQNQFNEEKLPIIEVKDQVVIWNKRKRSIILYDQENHIHNSGILTYQFPQMEEEFLSSIRPVSLISPLPNPEAYASKLNFDSYNYSWFHWAKINDGISNVYIIFVKISGYSFYREQVTPTYWRNIYVPSQGTLELVILNDKLYNELEKNKK